MTTEEKLKALRKRGLSAAFEAWVFVTTVKIQGVYKTSTFLGESEEQVVSRAYAELIESDSNICVDKD